MEWNEDGAYVLFTSAITTRRSSSARGLGRYINIVIRTGSVHKESLISLA